MLARAGRKNSPDARSSASDKINHSRRSLTTLTTPARYRIRVQGQLGPQWADWFVGFTLNWKEPDETVLVGQVVDQAALYGLLNILRDLGLPLLEVLRLPPEESGAADR